MIAVPNNPKINKTYVSVRELVSIRVGNGQKDPVEVPQQIRLSVVLDQLVDGPSDSGRRDPLSSVDSAFEEDDGFPRVFEVGGGNLQVPDGTAFEGIGRGHQFDQVGVSSRDVLKIVVDLKRRLKLQFIIKLIV